MMQQMRENTKWIMLVTALSFVALMVFEWGMDLTGRSGAQAAGGEIGRVNGEPITMEEYNAVHRNIREQQQRAQDEPITLALERQIEEAAWEQVVTQKLLAQELRRRGIRVTDAEILQAVQVAPPPELQANPAFQTNGEFDLQKYQQFLGSPALGDEFLQQLEAYYRDIIPRSKLFFQTTAGSYLSDGQLWRLWRDANETATVRYIAFSPDDLVPDAEVTIGAAEIREYYNDHRGDFVRPAQASVRYVVLTRAPAPADSAAARTRAQELRSAIAGGESFEVVARRASGTDSLSRTHGELFTVARGQSGPALEQAVFGTEPGQVSDPVLSVAGYHVIGVQSRAGDTAQVRQIVVPIQLAPEAENRLLDRADSLENVADRSGLQQATTVMQLPFNTAELSPALPFLPGVGTADDAVDWVFKDGQPGELSQLFETSDAYYMVELVSKRDEGTLSLQEATPTIRTVLVRQAKLARARERLTDAERGARAGQPLEQIAATYRGTVQQAGPFARGDFVPGLGRLNTAVGAAFGLRPGQASGLIEAEGQLFLIQVVDRVEPDRTAWEAQKTAQRQQVQQALADARWQQYMVALRESAEIVDNRAALRQQQQTVDPNAAR
jgi:parvulin-like peptidyl-prolyl isomerase